MYFVQAFMKDEIFKNDKSVHKYAILYSSSFFKVINYTVRHFDDLSEHKYTCKFYLKFIKYFYKHGIYKKDLGKITKYLYRGYNEFWTLQKAL